MTGRECFHCKQWIREGEAHDCWTTTEAALTQDLSDDLREAWERVRETAVGFGDQRIYASHHSIMFTRKGCYFFVRPKKSFLELCVFLGREVKAPQVRRVDPASKAKIVHFIRTMSPDCEHPTDVWIYCVKIAKSISGAPLKPTASAKKGHFYRGLTHCKRSP